MDRRSNCVQNGVEGEAAASGKPLKEWSEWQDSNLRPLRPERTSLL
jgi:hypothetical protein